MWQRKPQNSVHKKPKGDDNDKYISYNEFENQPFNYFYKNDQIESQKELPVKFNN